MRLAPWPTKISSNSEPAAWKNGTPASPATALANSVLPVPGGPTSNTPLIIQQPLINGKDKLHLFSVNYKTEISN